MKPKFLMQEAIMWIISIAALGILVIVFSVDMFFNPDEEIVANMTTVLLALAVSVKIALGLEYCRMDEKGITFFLNFKRHSFIAWESILKVERRSYGHGRSRENRIVIYNDEYFKELVSSKGTLEPQYARSFRITMDSDKPFSEYLKYYRPDIKIEEI